MDEPTQQKANPKKPITLLCGRLLTGDPAYYPQAKYSGRTLYFCTESCLHAFHADPNAFITAHSRTANKKSPDSLLQLGKRERHRANILDQKNPP